MTQDHYIFLLRVITFLIFVLTTFCLFVVLQTWTCRIKDNKVFGAKINFYRDLSDVMDVIKMKLIDT